jgi:hypothetical protein
MTHVPVHKVRIAVPSREVETLMRTLHAHGTTEPIRATVEGTTLPDEETAHDATALRARCEEALSFLGEYHTPSFFRNLFEGGRVHTSEGELEALLRNGASARESILATVQRYTETLGTVAAEEKLIRTTLSQLADWERLGLPLSDITETRYARVSALRDHSRALARLLEESESGIDIDKHSYIVKVGDTTLLAVVSKPYWDEFARILDTYDIEVVTRPESELTR